MIPVTNQSNNNFWQSIIHFFISDLPTICLCLALFFGGIWLLSLRIPGWSIFFGLIMIPLGVCFTIYTLDHVARIVVIPPPFKPVKCNVCGRITYAKEDEKDAICGRCRKEITREILKEKRK